MNNPPSGFDHLYREVFRGSPCAIFIANDEGRFIDVNPAAELLLGAPCAEIVGRQVHDFVAPLREDHSRALWDTFLDVGRQAGRFIISRADGTDRKMCYVAVTHFMPGLHLSVAFDEQEMVDLLPPELR